MEEIQRPLEVIETEINFYKNQTATGIIEIGKRLIEAKAQLPHGEWGKWLEEKFTFTRQTANKFMRIAGEYSNVNAPLQLGTEKLWLLLDVPQDQREEFISQNKVDEMTTRELQKAIRKNNELQRQLEAEKDKPAKVIRERIEVKPSDYDSLKVKLQIKEQEIERLKLGEVAERLMEMRTRHEN